MKVTLDIPDELYRRVKARSAMEGRPVRSVSVELFESWLDPRKAGAFAPKVSAHESPLDAPWLAITRPHLRKGMSHDIEAIREAAAKGWAADIESRIGKRKTRKPTRKP
jgi:hypothetical protein